MTEIVTDWRGNTYTVGSTVLYPRMSGRSVEMCEATVERIWWKGEEMRVSLRPNGRGARGFYRTDTRAVYIDKSTGEEVSWLAAKDLGHDRYELRWDPIPIKPVTITCTENITAVVDGSP